MNAAVELHDSECLEVEVREDGGGFVLLDAYVHRSEGRPGWEAGEGGIQRVRLSFDSMTVDGVIGDLPACIYEGSLEAGDGVHENMIALERNYAGAVLFKMMLSENARILLVAGAAMTLRTESEFCYVEQFSPASPRTLPN